MTELLRALAACCEAPSAAVAAALELPVPAAADHAELFSLQLYPYASVYAGAEGMLGGEAADRVAGFWRAVGAVPPAEPDHLAALLGLYAALAGEVGERARHVRHALLWEHLLSWLPAWLARAAEVAPGPYARWASLLGDALLAEAEELGPPAALPLHLRLAPPSAGVGTLLAPVRGGVILTRADLGRTARELGLGVRQGERRRVLHALLAQDPAAVLDRLAGEAGRQAEIHRSLPSAWRPVTEHWASRAEATAGELSRVAEEAKEMVFHAG
ncbi:MAG TPA: molecular chaperone TorD family protein [Candidatus Eisenbacteria bacterium]|nr:molecular chaperone TorD family protein [Candidatus Eisenbacteria bacterium]